MSGTLSTSRRRKRKQPTSPCSGKEEAWRRGAMVTTTLITRMGFSMQQLFNLPPPPTINYPKSPSASCAGPARAWARSSNRAVPLGEPRSCCRRSRTLPQHVAAASSSRSFVRPLEATIGTEKSTKFFEAETMTVRDCEVDQYGVVDDAAYACYIEKAREEMFASLGFGISSVARTGRAMAVSELKFKYLAPLKRGAKFIVTARVAQIKGVRMLVEYLMFETFLPQRKLVLEATATVVCLDKDYRPTRVFPEMLSAFMS